MAISSLLFCLCASFSLLMGYDGYLHKACARIYDKDFKYYIDFDWYKRYTYEEAIAMKASQEAQGGLFHLPEGYSVRGRTPAQEP